VYAASDVVARDVHERIGGAHLLLLTDYDGTLAEIAPTPDEAVVSPDVHREVVHLAALSDVTFGVVSGRRLTDVRERVGPAAEFAAGLHGLEIVGPGCRFHHEALDPLVPVIAEIAAEAAHDLAWCPGVYLENKIYALTCHVRRVPAELAPRAIDEFREIAAPYLEDGVLKSLAGTKALELLPAVSWHKGRAAVWIRARVEERVAGPIAIVYLGDDRTDEDAFDALGEHDVVIGVGDRPHAHLIDWRLAGPASVGRFLGRLARLRAR
jgi:trehalose-phosphatase